MDGSTSDGALTFANDVFLISSIIAGLQDSLNRFTGIIDVRGLHSNPKKFFATSLIGSGWDENLLQESVKQSWH